MSAENQTSLLTSLVNQVGCISNGEYLDPTELGGYNSIKVIGKVIFNWVFIPEYILNTLITNANNNDYTPIEFNSYAITTNPSGEVIIPSYLINSTINIVTNSTITNWESLHLNVNFIVRTPNFVYGFSTNLINNYQSTAVSQYNVGAPLAQTNLWTNIYNIDSPTYTYPDYGTVYGKLVVIASDFNSNDTL